MPLVGTWIESTPIQAALCSDIFFGQHPILVTNAREAKR